MCMGSKGNKHIYSTNSWVNKKSLTFWPRRGFLAMSGGMSSFLSTFAVLWPIKCLSWPRTLWI